MRWRDITTSEDYQNLTPENKLVTKQEFFRSQVLPQVRQEPVLNRFSDEALERAWLDLPDDSGQGYFTSLLGSAGRGFTSVAPGVVGGLGYLTGSETLKQAGEDIEESLAEAIPVNPRYEQDFAMKAAGAVGQAGSMLATGGIGGTAAKGLAAVKGLNQATQIARAGQAARGAQLGSGFLQGTRGGGQEAEQYGLEGPAAYARTVGGGVIEGATELLPFGLGTESAAVRRLLGETGEKVTRGFVEDVGTEAAEEAFAQTASNIATMGTLAATGSEVEGPGVFDDTLESAALGAVGGATFGGVNLLTGARDPREFKDPIDGGEMPMTPFPEVNDLVEAATPELAEVTSPEAAEVVGEAVKQASEVALATPGETEGDLLTDFAVQPTPEVTPQPSAQAGAGVGELREPGYAVRAVNERGRRLLALTADGDFDQEQTRRNYEEEAKRLGISVEQLGEKIAEENQEAAKDLLRNLNDRETVEWVDGNGVVHTGVVEIDLLGNKKLRDTTEGSPAEDFLYGEENFGFFTQIGETLRVTGVKPRRSRGAQEKSTPPASPKPSITSQPPAPVPSGGQFPTAQAPSQPTYADIARKAAAVASGETPPQVSQAVEAVLENRATPEQVDQLEEQGLADTVAGEPVITDEGAAQLPADEQPALDEQERREEITLQNPEEARRDIRAIEQMRPGVERAAAIAQFSIKYGVPTTIVTEAQLDEYIGTATEPETAAPVSLTPPEAEAREGGMTNEQYLRQDLVPEARNAALQAQRQANRSGADVYLNLVDGAYYTEASPRGTTLSVAKPTPVDTSVESQWATGVQPNGWSNKETAGERSSSKKGVRFTISTEVVDLGPAGVSGRKMVNTVFTPSGEISNAKIFDGEFTLEELQQKAEQQENFLRKKEGKPLLKGVAAATQSPEEEIASLRSERQKLVSAKPAASAAAAQKRRRRISEIDSRIQELTAEPSPAPQAEPTTQTATLGEPTSRDVGVAPQRDTTKPEQMTPGEWASEGKEYVTKAPDGKGGVLATFYPREGAKERKTRGASLHKGAINVSVRSRLPVSAEAVDAYNIPLPEGYIRQGDLYVYQPDAPTTQAPTTDAIQEPITTEGVLRQEGPPVGLQEVRQEESDSETQEVDVTQEETPAELPLPEDQAPQEPPPWWDSEADAIVDRLMEEDVTSPTGQGRLRRDVKELSTRNPERFKEVAEAVGAKPNVASVVNGIVSAFTNPVATEEVAKPKKAKKPRKRRSFLAYGKQLDIQVREGDIAAAVEAEADTPGAAQTQVGTSDELIDLYSDNPKVSRMLEQAKAAGAEGFYDPDTDMVFVLTDELAVYESDRDAAAVNNTTPAQEAVRRVIRHENVGHRGWGGMPQYLRDKWLAVANQLMSAEDADDLVNRFGYKEYKDWRTNETSRARLFEEWVARKAEEPKFAKALSSQRYRPLRDFLRELWGWITGNTNEVDPDDKQLLELFNDMRRGAKVGRTAKVRPKVRQTPLAAEFQRLRQKAFAGQLTGVEIDEYAAKVSKIPAADAKAIVNELGFVVPRTRKAAVESLRKTLSDSQMRATRYSRRALGTTLNDLMPSVVDAYHRAAEGSSTAFIPLTDIYQNLPPNFSEGEFARQVQGMVSSGRAYLEPVNQVVEGQMVVNDPNTGQPGGWIYLVDDAPRFSLKARDSKHADLERRAKAGDEAATEEAKRMVEEAARAAGYDVGPLFHAGQFGLSGETKLTGWTHFGTRAAAEERVGGSGIVDAELQGIEVGEDPEGWWFTLADGTDSVDLLGEDDGYFPSQQKAQLKAEEYAIQTADYAEPPSEEFGGVKFTAAFLKGPFYRTPDLGMWDLNEVMAALKFAPEERAAVRSVRQQRPGDEWDQVASILKKRGFNGIVYQNAVEDVRNDSYIVINATDAKSADPFTYVKESGNLIPLSERFTPESDDIRFSLKAVENYESRKRSFDNSMRRPFAAQAAGQRPTSGEFAARVQKERLPSETLEQAAIELIKEIGPMREWARKLRDGNWVADNGISAELHHAAVREATLQATQAEQASGGRDSEASFVAERMRRLDEQLSSEAGRQLRMRGIAVDSKRFNELYAINALKSTQDQQLASTLDRIVNVRNAVERTEDVDASAREEAATNVSSELELLELGMSMLDPKVKGLVTELNDELAILGLLSQQDLKASLTGRTPAELDALREKIASMSDAEKQAQLETSRARVAKLIHQIRKTAKKDGPTPQEQAEQLLATAGKQQSKRKPAPRPVRDAYRDQLRNPVTRSEFLKKLTDLGVEADTAQKLFDTAAAKVASAAAVEEAELSREQKTANSLIDSLANTHSDTPAWPKTAKVNQMRELYRKHMKEPMERDAFVNEAVDLGVTEQSAGQLWDIAQNELVARGRVKDAKREEALEKARAKRRQALLDLTPKTPRTKGESKPRSLLGLLNKVRREAGVNWTELFSHPFEYQKQWRQELFNKVRADAAFRDLSDQEVRDVAAELDRLWNAERQKIVERELKKLTPSTNPEVRERVSKSTSRLLRAINNGSLNDAEFRKAIAPQFGIGQLTQEELDEVGRLAQIIQDEDAVTPEKNRASIKLMELLQSRSNLSAAEVLSNIWVTSVLSGLRTQFDMAFNFLNGIRIFGQMAASTAIRTGETKLVGRAAKDYFGTLLNGMREALVYIGTGDAALLNSTEKRMNSYLGEGVRAVPQDIWERITKDPETPTYQKPFSAFLALVQRAMIAWDHITSASTTEGMKALAVANNQAAYANARLPTKEDIAKAQARAEQIVAGELPAGANLKSQANQARITVARRQILDDIYEKQFPGLLDQARDIGLVSAYQNDPTGVGGFIYHTLLNLTKTLTQSAKQFRGRVDAELSDAEKMRLSLRVRDAMAKLAMFTAVNSRNLTGTRFVRFVGNKINEMLSFLPGVGLTRLAEDVMQENPLQRQMLYSNQVVGGMVSTALLATVLKSAFDSDAEDEENPPFMVNGPWKPLTSAQRNAMRSVGSAPNTIEFRDDEGNVTVFNYANWPISGLLATAGNMMDLYRFNRKKWDEKDFLDRVGSAAVSGALVFTDMSAISGLMNVLATTANERDPTEGFLNRLSQWAANYAGGFIPRMAKDIDTLTSPEYERPVDRLDYFIKEVPFYRRGRSGNRALNLMGEPVKINREPWSRAVVRTTVEKPYRVAAELMEKGVFFTAPNPLNRTVKIPGTDERRNLTDAESETYVKESGKMYRQFFDSEGDSLVEMEPDLAKKYVDERLRSFRDLALTLATQ